jgi:glucan phosphoethanolaminetransferase (alkaline phosphatase superfamily)
MFYPKYLGFDSGIIHTIFLVESARRASIFTPLQLPLPFVLIGRITGLGIVNPIYLFVNYVFSPVEAFKATDMRLTSTKYTKGILPMMVLWHYLPVLLMYSWPTFLGQASWHLFWKINPLLISVSLLLISRCFADTTMQDRVHNPLCDLPTIYSTLGLTTALSAAARVRNFAQGSILPSNMWALATASRHDDICIFTDAVINEALLSLSVFMWLGYLLWDLKHSGMIQAGYLKIILFGCCHSQSWSGSCGGLCMDMA